MTHYAPESDGSNTKRRSPRTKRRPRDGEGADLDCQGVTFGLRDAVSKHEGALTKPGGALAKGNVALSIQGVAFSRARAPFSIRIDTFPSLVRHSRNQVALSQFIGRDYRFKARLFRRKRATSNPNRPFSDEEERRSIPEGTLTIHMRSVETKHHVHEGRKPQSKWLPSTTPFIAPRSHSNCPARFGRGAAR